MNPWVRYAGVMAAQGLATIAGFFLLAIPCLFWEWTINAQSIKDQRPIDSWDWKWLNSWYGNPEDGVSGECAIVNNGPYMPNANASWRAYCWSAGRNSCDALKYKFAWKDGPLKQVTIFGKTFSFGWKPINGIKVPVFSGN
jgi:hypothetical protein